jgi:thioredoxin-related protein
MEEIKEHTYKWYEFGCKDASYLEVKKDYSQLSFSEKFLLTFHLATCKYCRRFVKQVNAIDALLKAGISQTGLSISPKKKQAINQLITNKLSENK